MMTRINFVIVISCFLLIVSCKEKCIEIPEFTVPDSDKVVLLEEFTGVRCPACPAGAAEVESLLQLFGDNLVSVAIHTPFQGQPFQESLYDFVTPEGIELENCMDGWLGKPAAAINRKFREEHDYTIVAFPDNWAPLIREELESFARLYVYIENDYDLVSRDLTVKITVDPQEFVDGDLRLSVMLTESEIIDPQLDGQTTIPDYNHKHVLRDMLSPPDGRGISNSLTPGQTVESTFTYTLPDEAGWWVADNLNIVAFVSIIEGSTKEVLQAAEEHL